MARPFIQRSPRGAIQEIHHKNVLLQMNILRFLKYLKLNSTKIILRNPD